MGRHTGRAKALAARHGWKRRLIGGGSSAGYVFVFEDSDI
jgi:hypothetical protein